jgi:hypothetical protein
MSHLLEFLYWLFHKLLKDRLLNFLTCRLLYDALGPVLSGCFIERGAKAKDWLSSQFSWVIEGGTTYHARSVKKGQLIYRPWHTSYFGTYLNHHLANYRPDIFPSSNSSNQHNLWDYGYLSQEILFDFVIEGTSSLGAWKKENYCLYLIIHKFCLECFFPHL